MCRVVVDPQGCPDLGHFCLYTFPGYALAVPVVDLPIFKQNKVLKAPGQAKATRRLVSIKSFLAWTILVRD